MHRWPSYPYIINDDVDRNLVNLDTIIVWIPRTSVIQSFMDSIRPGQTQLYQSDNGQCFSKIPDRIETDKMRTENPDKNEAKTGHGQYCPPTSGPVHRTLEHKNANISRHCPGSVKSRHWTPFAHTRLGLSTSPQSDLGIPDPDSRPIRVTTILNSIPFRYKGQKFNSDERLSLITVARTWPFDLLVK